MTPAIDASQGSASKCGRPDFRVDAAHLTAARNIGVYQRAYQRTSTRHGRWRRHSCHRQSEYPHFLSIRHTFTQEKVEAQGGG